MTSLPPAVVARMQAEGRNPGCAGGTRIALRKLRSIQASMRKSVQHGSFRLGDPASAPHLPARPGWATPGNWDPASITDEIRDFIRWYAGYQTAEGNLPDCADCDGAEWLPEYDCWGEFILAIMDYFQWPEISWRDPQGPSFIGDMPHAWIGAEYILSIRSLFAYEREADQALVIAAGIAADWLNDAGEVVVKDLPTYYGRLSYTLRRQEPATLRLTLAGALTLPKGGIVVKPPLPRPLIRVEVNGRKIETFDAASTTCREYPPELVMMCDLTWINEHELRSRSMIAFVTATIASL